MTVAYERVETTNFIIHRVFNDETDELEQLGFEMKDTGEILDHRTFLASQQPVPVAVASPASRARVWRPRAWLAVALSSTISATVAIVVTHVWR